MPNPQPSPVNVAAGAVIATPGAEAESPMKPVIDKIQTYVPTFVSWAARGKDIEEAADFLLDEVESEIVPLIVKCYRPGGITLNASIIYEQLIQKAQEPAQVAAIFEAIPALAPYRDWCEKVIAKSVGFLTAPDPTEPPAASA